MASLLIALLLLIAIIFILYIPHLIKKYKIKKWYTQLNLQRHYHVFCSTTQTTNGFTLSRQAREDSDAPEYTYGEVDFFSFVALLSTLPINEETVFYDLGSGVGKAVFIAAMVFKCKQCIGIELFLPLHQEALEIKARLATFPDYQTDSISFIQANFLSVDLQKRAVIFINASAFFQPLWQDICDRLHRLSPGSLVITTSRRITFTSFKLIKSTHMAVSWGVVRVYVYKRLSI
jgi:SAM-dependent methyltransferase